MSDDPIRLPEPDSIAVQMLVDAFEHAWAQRQTDEQIRPLVENFEMAPAEVILAVWCRLTAQGVDQIDKAKYIHRHCARGVLCVFGVPMGEAGIGITPRKIIMWNDPVYSGPSK